ncbi:DNA-methyltransferase [Stigmatella aurantiaca]|uniref:Methyltransferase n=1 Tax=Stigmatella aurantiaca (strain DW4/3-1) TaxID=378806 RepID=Q092W2_STIAD|nr:site-specific DNA-methyltransferase [Stigmatella aurantiaca]ADO73671.1 adenine-specific DNA methyltransferase [Stigmatella aurantiaca DW4/3-1]EAU66807.1 DNA methylase [Stigmatella aurantiaca DW4/3-1]
MSAEATALKLVEKSLKQSEFAKSDAYKLYQGDSVELLNQFPEQQFDLVFADPPYFLSNGGFTCKSGKRASVAKGAWDVSRGVEEDHRFTTEWLKACQRVLKPTGTLWVSGTQHVIFNVGFAMQKLGFKLLNTVTWYKPNASPNLSCRYFTHSTELLIWASPKPAKTLQHTFNYARMKTENGGKQMRDVWNLPRTGEEELSADGAGRMWTQIAPRREEKAFGSHPTQKPVALLERIIEASTPEDATVLDPFNGSGTTGVAALKLGRRYTGIDLDPTYLSLTKKRLDAVKR